INIKLINNKFKMTDLKNLIYNLRHYLPKIYNKDYCSILYGLLDELVIETFECTRTNNAITFKNRKSKVQIILILYKTPSEILHGFDVDSCCLGFDSDNVWMTQRAYFTLKNGY